MLNHIGVKPISHFFITNEYKGIIDKTTFGDEDGDLVKELDRTFGRTVFLPRTTGRGRAGSKSHQRPPRAKVSDPP